MKFTVTVAGQTAVSDFTVSYPADIPRVFSVHGCDNVKNVTQNCPTTVSFGIGWPADPSQLLIVALWSLLVLQGGTQLTIRGELLKMPMQVFVNGTDIAPFPLALFALRALTVCVHRRPLLAHDLGVGVPGPVRRARGNVSPLLAWDLSPSTLMLFSWVDWGVSAASTSPW